VLLLFDFIAISLDRGREQRALEKVKTCIPFPKVCLILRVMLLTNFAYSTSRNSCFTNISEFLFH
jgi:hypothetical protein